IFYSLFTFGVNQLSTSFKTRKAKFAFERDAHALPLVRVSSVQRTPVQFYSFVFKSKFTLPIQDYVRLIRIPTCLKIRTIYKFRCKLHWEFDLENQAQFKMDEVEDIMCDQCILSPEFNVQFADKKSYLVLPATKLWVAIDLLARALLPSVTNLYSAFFRNPQAVVSSVRNQLIPALAAFLANSVSRSLASVQRISFPLTIRIVKVDENKAVASTEEEDLTPEKSVECLVLSEPENGEIEADVIFIHGLHGGIDKTWKQGTWRHSGHKLIHQTPIRRQSSGTYIHKFHLRLNMLSQGISFPGDLYVPPRQQSLKRTLSDIYSKIPNKIARQEEQICVVPSQPEWEEEECFEEGVDYSQCWPQDWIHKDCPNVRVIALNYTTDVLWCPVWAKRRNRTDMVVRSQEMIEELLKLGVGRKPIIWVGHSKGGLFIKQIIVNAWENNEHRTEVFDLFQQSKSIMWYSVPHKGSSMADFTLPLLRRSVEVLEIQRNCEFVLDLHKRFLEIVQNNDLNIEVFSFIETSFTLMSFIYLKIVAYDSADPNIGIKCDVPLDHREICKPAGRDCFLYTELVKLINRCIERHR
ncbi:hypothetical protein NQ315_008607, partial [Exocentrus adspersus]